jgi:hypothetical protein
MAKYILTLIIVWIILCFDVHVIGVPGFEGNFCLHFQDVASNLKRFMSFYVVAASGVFLFTLRKATGSIFYHCIYGCMYCMLLFYHCIYGCMCLHAFVLSLYIWLYVLYAFVLSLYIWLYVLYAFVLSLYIWLYVFMLLFYHCIYGCMFCMLLFYHCIYGCVFCMLLFYHCIYGCICLYAFILSLYIWVYAFV